MGVNLSGIVEGREIEFKDLAGKKIAIDAFNWIYQFLSTIRLEDGSMLTDKQGRPTSHLNGLFFRTITLIENNIVPIYVFDGKPPIYKIEEIKRRKQQREEAAIKAQQAQGEEKLIYAREATSINEFIIESSKQLLEAMGVPIIHAPSEGEAECAYLSKVGKVFAAASQDYDSLLFGTNILVRNLNVAGRRKIPGKPIYKKVNIELINSKDLLSSLGITREQLILIGMFLGTDYNDGVYGIGVKRALALVKEKPVEEILKQYDFGCEDKFGVFNYFLSPEVVDVDVPGLGVADEKKILDLLVGEFDFSEERVREGISRLKKRSATLI
jgi:flap endonuclease-1